MFCFGVLISGRSGLSSCCFMMGVDAKWKTSGFVLPHVSSLGFLAFSELIIKGRCSIKVSHLFYSDFP